MSANNPYHSRHSSSSNHSQPNSQPQTNNHRPKSLPLHRFEPTRHQQTHQRQTRHAQSQGHILHHHKSPNHTTKHRYSTRTIVVIVLGLLVILGLLIALISCGMRYTKAKKTKQNAAISPTTTARAALSNDASPRINTDKDATIVDYDKDGILVHAPEGFTDTSSYGELVDAVDEFESYGYTLSFSLLDLNTGRSLDYNKDTALYPASAIKAAYTAMVYETHGGASGLAGVAENCIVNSDNESFHTLIHTFGLSSYGNWLTQHGAPNAGQIAYVHYYPKISAAELSNVWQEIFRYGVSGEKGSEEFTNFLAQSNHTSMGGLLRDRYTVWAKPGWYPKDGTGNEATVDAGVVFSDCGPYVFVVMSNAPEDFNAMFPLEDALNAAHGCMCGGSIDLLQTDYTSLPGIS